MTMHKTAEVAAKWWADKFRNPSEGPGQEKLIGPETAGEGAVLAATIAQASLRERKYNPDAVDRFEAALAETIKEQSSPYRLSVDYEPDAALKMCASLAGLNIPFGGWPIKTSMTVSASKVVVSEGYAQPTRSIFEVAQ